MAVLRLVVIQ